MSIEKYYTIYESSEFLTSGFKQLINKRDVLDFAARGFIRLCMWFEENVEISRYNPDAIGKLEPICTGEWFKGYIQIPKDSISLASKGCYFVYAEVVEAISIGTNKESKDLPRNTRLIIQKVKSYDSYTGTVVYDDGISVKHKNTLVPAIDLQYLIAKNQEPAPNNQPELQATKSENIKTKKLRRDCLDTAIDKAIGSAENYEYADVYQQLKKMALNETPPFNGFTKDGSLCYTNDNDELADFSKNALRQRLKRRREKSITNAK